MGRSRSLWSRLALAGLGGRLVRSEHQTAFRAEDPITAAQRRFPCAVDRRISRRRLTPTEEPDLGDPARPSRRAKSSIWCSVRTQAHRRAASRSARAAAPPTRPLGTKLNRGSEPRRTSTAARGRVDQLELAAERLAGRKDHLVGPAGGPVGGGPQDHPEHRSRRSAEPPGRPRTVGPGRFEGR